MVPLITTGICISQDPDNGAVGVLLNTTGQGMPAPVKVLYYGPADSLRINQQPLPGVGSLGLLAFPHGDIRNGVWMGTILQSGIDAITSTSSGVGPTDALDAFTRFTSHWSGHAELLDAFGQTATQWIDGSYLAVASDAGPSGVPEFPMLTRHVVNDGQVRMRQITGFDDRVDEVQDPPFNFGFAHASGTNIYIDPDGSLTVSGVGDMTYSTSGDVNVSASGAITLTASGQMTLTAEQRMALNSSQDIDFTSNGGNVNITVNSGQTVTVTAGSTSWKIDASGNVVVSLGGNLMEVGGTVHQVVLADALVTAFNNHVHGGVSAGPGFTLSPLIPLNAAAIGSAVLKTGS